jgi:hypothetical protein
MAFLREMQCVAQHPAKQVARGQAHITPHDRQARSDRLLQAQRKSELVRERGQNTNHKPCGKADSNTAEVRSKALSICKEREKVAFHHVLLLRNIGEHSRLDDANPEQQQGESPYRLPTKNAISQSNSLTVK